MAESRDDPVADIIRASPVASRAPAALLRNGLRPPLTRPVRPYFCSAKGIIPAECPPRVIHSQASGLGEANECLPTAGLTAWGESHPCRPV